MRKDHTIYLEDILICIKKIEQYTDGMDFEVFKNNQLVVDAVIRNLEVIGEASCIWQYKNVMNGKDLCMTCQHPKS